MDKNWILGELADTIPTCNMGPDSMGMDVLTPRQLAMVDSQLEIVYSFGQFDQTDGPDGVDYDGGDENDDLDEGLSCANCVFFDEGSETYDPSDPNDLDTNGPDTNPGSCALVSGDIDPQGLCKLWVIPADNLNVQAAQMARKKRKSRKQPMY
jgi:hypothetical protein